MGNNRVHRIAGGIGGRRRCGAFAVLLAAVVGGAVLPSESAAQTGGADAVPVKTRNIGVSRERATRLPRSEGDQALVDGWPLYRSERGQTAFNDAMATLKATDAAAPVAGAFKGCTELDCTLSLPALGPDGWIPAGRIWVSPSESVLFVHSPRLRDGQSYRRRSSRDMKYFVFHEFHNGTRNTDTYDTVSSHSGSVFVPFYMSKSATDAKGRRFVTIVQVAPHDVVSIHASNHGSAGPGIEVAKNTSDALEPLQGLAGILVATIVKTAAPQLRVVNHRGSEGQPMLSAYERRLAALRSRPAAQTVVLPFVPAQSLRVASAGGRLDDLILRRGASPKIPIAERGIVPPRVTAAAPAPVATAVAAAAPLSPLGEYLRANLATMMRRPDLATIIPAAVAAVAEESPDEGVVYLMDASHQILGHIEAHRQQGVTVRGKFIYVPVDHATEDETPFDMDVTRPAAVRSAALTLVEPVRPASRPETAAAAAEPALPTARSPAQRGNRPRR